MFEEVDMIICDEGIKKVLMGNLNLLDSFSIVKYQLGFDYLSIILISSYWFKKYIIAQVKSNVCINIWYLI